jgi:hypothetical protein
MVKNIARANYSAFLWTSVLIILVLLIPIALAIHPAGVIVGVLVFIVAFVFPGYLFLTLLNRLSWGLRILLSPIFGILTVTTTYDIFCRASIPGYFPYLVVALSVAGMTVAALQVRNAPRLPLTGYESAIAGSVAALTVAPVFWRSGRFSNGEFVFYGPAGQDQLYHVSLLQRLLHHVPPDNLMVAGLRAPVYHYFDDLTLAVILRVQNALHLGATDVFDLFYRCYPIIVYFLIGALAYRAGRELLGKARGGILSVLLLLGTGGLGWIFGALQTALHAVHFVAMRAALFSNWTSWDGVDAMFPLVHRPAHYHSLLICLAAINVLLRPERSRRDWILAGLLLGLMAGFNFTLAATFGIATVLGCVILFLKSRQDEARDLAWLTLFIFLGSLPVTGAMVLSGFHSVAVGFPFRGPNLEYPASVWGPLLGQMIPQAIVPWAALLVLPVVAFGIKLFGCGAMARFDLGEECHSGIALVFAIVFFLSFVTGVFFPYKGVGGIAVVFLQPTLWILGFFALHPIDVWLGRNQGSWRRVVLWGILGLTWVQALVAFNFCAEAAFSQDAARALQDIRLQASPDDVVAFLPGELTERPVWGHTEISTNYSITAMTGLDGYFSPRTYCVSFAVSGLSGSSPADVLAQADRLCQRRTDDVEALVKGGITDAAFTRLVNDHVKWVVVSGDAMHDISTSAIPWRKTPQIAVYRLSR